MLSPDQIESKFGFADRVTKAIRNHSTQIQQLLAYSLRVDRHHVQLIGCVSCVRSAATPIHWDKFAPYARRVGIHFMAR